MPKEIKDILNRVFCNVLKEQAFMFAEPTPPGELPEIPGALLARMTFSGSQSGTIGIAALSTMCTEIAANMLGLDIDDEEAANKRSDALKEFLNISCGQVLTALAGEIPVFTLSMPEVTPLDQSEWSALIGEDQILGFKVDDYPALLQFSIGNLSS